MAMKTDSESLARAWALAGAVWLAAALTCAAAGQTSTSYRVAADVFTGTRTGNAVGAAGVQASVSVRQYAVTGVDQVGGGNVAQAGFAAAMPGHDSDGDGTPDGADSDADGDGVPDAVDARPYDADGDGANNLNDADDDNDGLSDRQESLFGTSWLLVDTDGDEQTDHEEWIAGTIGTDSNSLFEILGAWPTAGGGVRIGWDGVPPRRYTVYAADDLTEPDPWSPVAVTNAAGPGPIDFVDTGAGPSRAYRLGVTNP